MWRALGLNMAVFGLLFSLHVVFAARDMDNAFAAVATLITLQIVAFGPLTARMSTSQTAPERRLVLRRSLPVALALAVGLAWAYGGMAWSTPALVGVLGASLVVHALADRRWSS